MNMIHLEFVEMRKLYRNIAIVTAVFMLVLSVMLGVSYYQMQQVSPLETGVMETLKAVDREMQLTELTTMTSLRPLSRALLARRRSLSSSSLMARSFSMYVLVAAM